MVTARDNIHSAGDGLSVLALSSRFDGPLSMPVDSFEVEAFSTRSVESF